MSTTTKITASISMVLLAGFNFSTTAHADPLQGEVLKFQQAPLNNLQLQGAIYNGHDELSTAYQGLNPTNPNGWQGTFMADDFADKLSSPIVHLSWWGSYIANPNNTALTKFLISFETDVPGSNSAGTFSQPGTPILSQVVTAGALAPGSGTFTEALVNGNVPEHLYKYNAELNLGQDFPEQKDTVYWLKIVALTSDQALQWGWHDRDYTAQDTFASPAVSPGETQNGPVWHFQDDAVSGRVDINPLVPTGLSVVQNGMLPTNYVDNIDGPPGIGNFSKDLAFELYTVPEPSSMALLGLGGLTILRRRR